MERRERGLRRVADGENRFDSHSVRRILERAALEQHRLDTEIADTYSLEELEEMAAEARISTEALRAAIEADPSCAAAAAARTAHGPDERHRSAFASLPAWFPPRRSPAVKLSLLVAGVGGLLGLLAAFPLIAQVIFWATILSLLLVLLGASPF